MYGLCSPQDWSLAPASEEKSGKIKQFCGMSLKTLEMRCQQNIYQWLPQQFSQEHGAIYGFYDARSKRFEPPQTVNLIAPWQLMAAYDRYGHQPSLHKAICAAEWLHQSPFVVTHPMSLAVGGVVQREAKEAWTKYSAEYAMLNLALCRRTGKDRPYLERALQSGEFLVQAARHHYATKFHLQEETWSTRGWQAFGRVIEAFLNLYEVTGEAKWRKQALTYGEYALGLQESNGCFYLLNGEYYNSDLAADPLRALVFLFEETKKEEFLKAARRFADWHIEQQTQQGAWPINIDREGNILSSLIGPGDMPNIGISLLRLHQNTHEERYLRTAIKAFQYSLSAQITPESNHPYKEDPKVKWGFWSWLPYYDYTVSVDQATHHVRGLMFLMDYLASLPATSAMARG